MNDTIILTPRVLRILRSLPGDARKAVAGALTNEILLGIPFDETNSIGITADVVYPLLRMNIERDSARLSNHLKNID